MDLILIVILLLILTKYLILTAPFVPAKKIDLSRLAALVEKYQVKNLVDLGCGNSRLIRYLAKRNPAARFTGIDISLLLCAWSWLWSWRLKNVKIKFGSFFWYDWSRYDSLYVFWLPKAFDKYRDKILKKIKPGQLVISYCFPIDFLSQKLLATDTRPNQLPIHVYRV